MKKIFTILTVLGLVFPVFANAAANVSSAPSPDTETDECVLANSTDIYEVKFKSGETATVLVIGDGDTDLDLYIYDENDNLIEADLDDSDTMICTWTPKWTGTFTIKIKNLGSVKNYYTMWTY